MEMLKLSSQDIRWMRRRLGHTVRLAALLIVISFLANGTGYKSDVAVQSRLAISPPARLVAYGGNDVERKLNPVPPLGWRRTTHGWEHFGTDYRSTDSIETLIERQAAQEPAIARTVLAQVSRWSPLTFASVQVVAILAIAVIERHRCKDRATAAIEMSTA